MLTKSDLQEITQIVQGETRKIVQSETRKIVQEELKPIKKAFKKLDEKTDVMAKLLDKEQMRQRKRLDRVENHLQLPPLS